MPHMTKVLHEVTMVRQYSYPNACACQLSSTFFSLQETGRTYLQKTGLVLICFLGESFIFPATCESGDCRDYGSDNAMSVQLKRKERRGGPQGTSKGVSRRLKSAEDTSLRTGSAAPSELSARPLEASIGIRGAADAQVDRPDRRRTRSGRRNLGRNAFEDREWQHLAVARHARRSRKGAQRAHHPIVRRDRRTSRLLVRKGRRGRSHRAPRHQGRASLRSPRPFAWRQRSVSSHI